MLGRLISGFNRIAPKSANGILVTREDQRVDPSSPNMSIIDLDFKCSGPVNSAYGKEVMKDIKKDEKKDAKKATAQ